MECVDSEEEEKMVINTTFSISAPLFEATHYRAAIIFRFAHVVQCPL